MAPPPWFVLLALAASNPSNPDLRQATDLMDELKYPEAARALEDARKRPGNDRATLLQILDLQATIADSLDKKPDRARGFLRTLASIDPDYKLSGNAPPKVLKLYSDAKLWVSKQGGPLQLVADPAPPPGQILWAGVRVASDPVKLAREVRFHLRSDGGPWRAEVVALASGRSSVSVTAHRLEWWVELLGEAQAVLAQVGSEREPLAWGTIKLAMPPPPPGLVEGPVLPGPRIPARPKAPAAAGGESSLAATVGWGLIALGGASAGAAGYFGLRSSEARARIVNAQTDPAGLTLGLTQKDAFALDAQARQDAVVANVLFGASGAMGAGGIAVLVFGHPVEVGVRPGGVSLESPIP